ncbi:unnamed protein product [Orchesella dallaii]|uniref:Peptidase S1 domain-containing protein n=1 Tax=Orchesella dallaii TaxID=48710 RepID=A0ABP1RPW2_9HEXA
MSQKLFFLITAYVICIVSAVSNQNLDVEPLVIGGVEAVPHQYPWLVRLYVIQANGDLRRCMGSLISLDIVLTTASCANTDRERIIIVVAAGDHSISEVDGFEQSLNCQEFVIHENFNKTGNLENDIALVRLPTNLTETRAVRPIFLPLSSYDPIQATWGTVAGWGETEISEGEPITRSDILMKTNVTLIDRQSCRQEFPSLNEQQQFCAEGNGKGAYKEDIGTPLLCNGMTIFCGIFTREVVNPETRKVVGLFLNVVLYLEWIELNVNPQPPTTTTIPTSTTPKSDGSSTSTGTYLFTFVISIPIVTLFSVTFGSAHINLNLR